MTDPREKLSRVRDGLNAALYEREDVIDALLTCLVAGEHPLLLGPPGTGKSFGLDGLYSSFAPGLNVFKTLVQKQMETGNLFGPLSVARLANLDGKGEAYVNLTDGYLPWAHFAFLDEVFKGSPAVLNSVLTVMNERKFYMGSAAVDCPLVMLVAASNEAPVEPDQASALCAVWDRFLVRVQVEPIRNPDNLLAMAFGGDRTPDFGGVSLTLADIEVARARVNVMSTAASFTDRAKECWMEILFTLPQEGVPVSSDRRKKKSVKMAAAAAYLAGRDRVEPEDLDVLRHVLWDDPREQPKKVAEVVGRIACPTRNTVRGFMSEAESILAGLRPSERDTFTAAFAKMEELAARAAARLEGETADRAAACLKYLDGRLAALKRAVYGKSANLFGIVFKV